ncbi:Glycine betaine-binding periplasmic protein OusX [Vibrio stylophorae]|uniref:Glycine betaine-binding periplasmic protein OusX n=1 Tax=Vibrio stylophorae TaxID=659351 RepID=A0ABN8DWH9_9VIBR|nr:glycine betaine/L-proline ABC transporter substrate-binding protein ProX [Vibrio stylophorae]CAH0535602.1 Glycine betaine-binding periplasmic protein OusX [Vibrio stylophorae]
MIVSWKRNLAAACLVAAPFWAQAGTLPGQGIQVQGVQGAVAEETFQTLIVNKALAELGYEVQPIKEVDYNVGYASVASGDATYLAVAWMPLHIDKYNKAGGDAKFYMKGNYITGAAQGYLIDKKTADKYKITNIEQLKDPKIAALFDANNDGKADLTGCNPGWGCELVIEHHLDAYELRDSVTHNRGNYAAIIADSIARYKQGEPILYYTWTPYWLSGVLVPGKDVTWLEVPFSSLPGARGDVDTKLTNGKNYGFEMNAMRIVANKQFAQDNPAAAKLFEVMALPINAVNTQNRMMYEGQNKPADVEAHADAWIKANRALFDTWIVVAKKAAQ